MVEQDKVIFDILNPLRIRHRFGTQGYREIEGAREKEGRDVGVCVCWGGGGGGGRKNSTKIADI